MTKSIKNKVNATAKSKPEVTERQMLSNAEDLKLKEKEFHSDMRNYESYTNPLYEHSIKPRSLNIQDSFLNNCRHEKTKVKVTLSNSIDETGIIVAFDSWAIIMNNETSSQFLIMKSAIQKIVPIRSVNYIFNDIHRPYISDGKICIDYTGDPRYQR